MPFTSTYLFVIGDHPGDHAVRRPAAAREGAAARSSEQARAARNVGASSATSCAMPGAPSPARAPRWSACSCALLPAGAYALSLALQSNLAVELGLDDNEVAQLNLVLDR